ncbi:MAG: YesL family protein [Clostridia bacterium]|nr:YesL family protein [Clostridia bacterium]
MSSKSGNFLGSRFYEIMEKLGDVVILSLLWTLCSIPVVTMGASSSALYYAIHKCLAGESTHPSKDFFYSFKSNLKQATVLTVVSLLYSAVAFFNTYVAYNGWGDIKLPDWYFPVSFLLFVPILFIAPFLFPYVARFSDSTSKVLKNSFIFGSIHVINSIEIILMMAASVAAFVVFPPCLLFIPYIVCRVTHFMTEKAFATVLMLMDKREHPEKYPEPNKDDSENADNEEDNEEVDEDDEDEDEEDEEMPDASSYSEYYDDDKDEEEDD